MENKIKVASKLQHKNLITLKKQKHRKKYTSLKMSLFLRKKSLKSHRKKLRENEENNNRP